jgi:hypothetical protein
MTLFCDSKSDKDAFLMPPKLVFPLYKDLFETTCKSETEAKNFDLTKEFFWGNGCPQSKICDSIFPKMKELNLKVLEISKTNPQKAAKMWIDDIKNVNEFNDVFCKCEIILEKIIKEDFSSDIFRQIFSICLPDYTPSKERSPSKFMKCALDQKRIDIVKQIQEFGIGLDYFAEYALQKCDKNAYDTLIMNYANSLKSWEGGHYSFFIDRTTNNVKIHAYTTFVSDDVNIIRIPLEHMTFKTNIGVNLDFPEDNFLIRDELKKKKALIVAPLFIAFSGILPVYGRIYKGNSLPVIKYLISQGAKINSDTMKGFSPYSLVKSSARSEKEKQEIIQYLKNELKVPDDGNIFNFDDWKCKFIYHTPCF